MSGGLGGGDSSSLLRSAGKLGVCVYVCKLCSCSPSLAGNSEEFSDGPKLETGDLDGQQTQLQEELWELNGCLCMFFLQWICKLNNGNNLCMGDPSVITESKETCFWFQGPCGRKQCSSFLWYVASDPNACSRAF